MNWFNKFKNSLSKIDVVGNYKKFVITSASIILAGLLVVIFFGFNLGMDFTGGTVLKVQMGESLQNDSTFHSHVNTIEQVLKDNGLTLSLRQKEGSGEETSIIVRFQDQKGASEDDMTSLIETLRVEIAQELSISQEQVLAAQRVGPSATATLLLNALLAILFAAILILIYIAIRFELLSGLSAIVSLIHDTLIMCSFVALLRIPVNSAFVAALITIIGYSLNNAIVIFDRVRENKLKDEYKNKTNAEIVNTSIKDTFRRTINTSATTLVMITILAILSVASIREFAIPIIFGLIAGTYSSICIAPPLWAIVNDRTRPKNPKHRLPKTPKPRGEEEILQV